MQTAISSGAVVLDAVVIPLSSQTTCVEGKSVRNCSGWIKLQQHSTSVRCPTSIYKERKKKKKASAFSHINVSHMFWFLSRTLMIHRLLPGASAPFCFGEWLVNYRFNCKLPRRTVYQSIQEDYKSKPTTSLIAKLLFFCNYNSGLISRRS